MRFGTVMLAASIATAACSSMGSSAHQPQDAGDAANGYGACTLGELDAPCSTCECAGDVWQPVTCPPALPGAGDACSAEGAYCGYTTETNPCGAANCYCQGGSWSCGPTCVFEAGAGGSTD